MWPGGSWALLAVLGLIWWLLFRRGDGGPPVASVRDGSQRSLLRVPLAWAVTAFFGLQAMVAFVVLGWLPQVLLDAGVGRGESGLVMALLAVLAVPISLLLPPLATRGNGQSSWIVALSLCGLAGIGGFLVAPSVAPVLWAILLGVGMSVFSLALTIVALRARTSDDTASLSGMTQGIGYAFAGTGPFLFGTLRDVTGSWTVPLLMLVVVLTLQLAVGAVAGRPRYV